jgi:hypothetical protein
MNALLPARVDLAINALALAGLLIWTAFNPQPAIYDEPHRMETVHVLREKGFTREFLETMPHAPGPLTAVMQNALTPLTNLEPPGTRLTNWALLIVLLACLVLVLRGRNDPAPATTAFAVISLPMTWVVAGMALTEMPAMTCLALGSLGLLAMDRAKTVAARHGWGLGAGALLSLAILGRQPYLLAALSVAAFGWCRRKMIAPALLCIATAVAAPVYVFSVWQGLVPPSQAGVGAGISLANGCHGLAYGALAMLLFAPAWMRRWRWWQCALLFAACAGLNAATGMVNAQPALSVARAALPAALFPLYIAAASGMFVFLAVWLLASLGRSAWRARHDGFALFLHAAAFGVMIACFKITGNFSSRYVAMAFPLLIPLAAACRPPGWPAVARSVVGNALGIASLLSYFRVHSP